MGPWTSIAQLMSSSPQRPYQLKINTFPGAFNNRKIVLSGVQTPSLPWNGSSPVNLLFSILEWERISGQIVVTLGCCNMPGFGKNPVSIDSSMHSPHTESPARHPLGEHYAAVHYYKDGYPGGQPVVFGHSCELDHLDLTRFPEYPRWAEWPIKRARPYHCTLLFRRSPLDAMGTILETEVLVR